MDANTIELIKTIATDSIKILGPAIIAVYATYKATMGQLKIKLKELDKKHEFGVREQLFNYYKDRLASLAKSYEILNDSLGKMIGMATGIVDTGIESVDKQFNELFLTMFEFAEMESRKTLLEIETTAMYMEQEGLKDSKDYNKLKSYIEPLQNLEKEKTLQVLRRNTIIILEAFHALQRCHQILIGKQMEQVFKKYIEE